MTNIAMDTEVMKKHIEAHRLVVDDAEKAVDVNRSVVNAGLGSASVDSIITKVSEHVVAIGKVHGTLAELLQEVIDAKISDETELTSALNTVARELDEVLP